jgi:N-acetyl-alpha-D-muramate 1-phosphate uridylyltransferase
MARRTSLPVAILAGGLATRLRPVTETVPKVLLEVAGKPFLEHQLAQLQREGVEDVVLCVGYLGEMIQEKYGDGTGYGVRLRYSFDGPKLLGTGGAIRNALPLLGEAFFVMYGDSYLRIDFDRVESTFRNSGKLGLMTIFHNQGLWDVSNISYSNGTIERYDKTIRDASMQHIDYGLSVFKSDVFAAYPPDTVLDLAQVMRTLVDCGEMAGFEAEERFYEIGSKEGWRELDEFLEHGVQQKQEMR